MTWSPESTRSDRQPQISNLVGLAVAFAPAAMLAIAAARLQGQARAVSIGLGVTLAVEALFVFTKVGSQRSVGGLLTVAFFVVAALCLRFNSPDMNWSGTHLMLAAVILCAIGLIVRGE